MADQLTFGPFVTSIQPTPFVAPAEDLEIDVEAIEKQRELFEESVKKSLSQAYLDWLKSKEIKGWGELNPVDYPDYDSFADNAERSVSVRAFSGKRYPGIAGDFVTDETLSSLQLEKSKRKVENDYQAWLDFQKFWARVNKRRTQRMNPILLQQELEMGGVDLNHGRPSVVGRSSPHIDVFIRSLIQGSTMGLINTDSPIYGQAYKQHFGKTHTAGVLIGDIIALMALSKGASSLGITAKIARALREKGQLSTALRLMGHIPASMRKFRGLENGLRLTGEFLAIPRRIKFAARTFPSVLRTGATMAGRRALAQSASVITSGLIFGFSDLVNDLTLRYLNEDKLRQEEWEKLQETNPAREFVFGALKGMGINIINAPSSWGARFLADGLWSTANQLKNTYSGGEWQWDQFIYDFLISHIIGERHQFFSETLPRALIRSPKHILNKRIRQMRRINPKFNKLDPELQRQVALTTLIASRIQGKPFKGELAKRYTEDIIKEKLKGEAEEIRASAEAEEQEFLAAANILTEKITEVKPVIEGILHGNYLRVQNPTVFMKERRAHIAREIGKNLKLKQSEIDYLIDNDSTTDANSLLNAFNFLGVTKRQTRKAFRSFERVKLEKNIRKLEKRLLKDKDNKRLKAEISLAKEQLDKLPLDKIPTLKGINDEDFREEVFRSLQRHAQGKGDEAAAFQKILSGESEDILNFISPIRREIYETDKKTEARGDERLTSIDRERINRLKGLLRSPIFTNKNLPILKRTLLSRVRNAELADELLASAYTKLLSDRVLHKEISSWIKGVPKKKLVAHPDFDYNNPKHLNQLAVRVMKNAGFREVHDWVFRKGEYAYRSEEEQIDPETTREIEQQLKQDLWTDDNTGEMTSAPDKVTPADEPFFERTERTKKFVSQAASYKKRIEEAGGDARYSAGVNADIVNNKHLAVMAEMARITPEGTINTLIRYWNDIIKLKHDQIRQHLGNYGLSYGIKDIEHRVRRARPNGDSWNLALNRLNEPLEVKVTEKATYNRQELQQELERASNVVKRVNPLTGIPQAIDNIELKTYIKDNGVMVIGTGRDIAALRAQKGADYAESLIAATGTFIRNEVGKYNRSYAGQKGNPRIVLRHPPMNNSTDFLITGRNIDPSEFKGVAVDIYNRITNRYPSTESNEHKAFAVRIGEDFYRKLPQTTLSYTKELADLSTISDKHVAFNALLKKVSPKQYHRITDIVMDMSNPKVRALVNDIFKPVEVVRATGRDFIVQQVVEEGVAARRVKEVIDDLVEKTPTSKEDLQTVIDEDVVLDTSKPAITRSEEEVEADHMTGESPKNTAAVRNTSKLPAAEKSMEKGIIQTRPKEDDDFGYHEFVEIANNVILQRANAVADYVERVENKTGLYDKMKGEIRERIKKIRDPLGELIRGKLTIFEDILKIDPAARDIIYSMGRKETQVRDTVRDIESNAYRKFYQKHGREKRKLTLYDFAEQYMATTELPSLSEGGKLKINNMLQRSAGKKSGKDMARVPITNVEKALPTIQKIISDPEAEWTEANLIEIWRHTKDNHLFTKMLVQYGDIPFDDIYDTAARSQELIWDFGGRLARDIQYPEGAYLKNNGIDNLREHDFKIFSKFFREWGFKTGIPAEKTKRAFFEELFATEDDPKAAATIAQMAAAVRDELIDAGLNTPAFQLAYNRIATRTWTLMHLNPAHIAYRHHAVMRDPENQKLLGSRANKMIEETRQDIGTGALNPMLYDIKNRKHRTLKELVEGGFKVHRSSRDIGRGFLMYVFTRQQNWELAQKWKSDFIDHTESVLKRLKTLEASYDEVKENVRDYDIKTQAEKMSNAVKEINNIKKETIAAWGEHKGYVYVDNLADNSFWKQRISKIEEALKSEEMDPDKREELEAEKVKLERWSVTAKDIHDFTTGQIFTRKHRDFLNFFKGKIPELDAAAVKDIENDLLKVEQADRGKINDAVFDANTGGIYMPIDALSHKKAGRSKKFSTYRGYIYNKPLRWDANKISIPDKMPGFEGLYIHRALHKGLKQFVFRHEYEHAQGTDATIKWGRDLYDTVNTTIKTLSFWKPTIVASNDLAQSALAIGLSPMYPLDLIRAFRAFWNKDIVGTNEHKQMYQQYRERNLFHHSIGFHGLVNHAVRDYGRLVGDNMAQTMAKQFFNGDISRAKHKFRTLMTKLFRTFNSYQNITWSIDEIMRMTVAENFRRRFYPIQLAAANRKGVRNAAATAMDEALWLAVERTNMFLADYSRIPDHVRRFLNRFIFVPTFKIAQSRMYKNMTKEFLEGVQVLFEGVPKDMRYKVSESKFEQAFFLMAPFMRKLVYTTAIKGLVMGLLGYNFEDKMDLIKGYRAKKIVNENDPMNAVVRYLSLSTPLFEFEKFFTRLGTGLNFRYMMAAFPGLLFSIATNKDRVSGRRIWHQNDPIRTKASKLALHLFKSFLPIGRSISDMTESDIELTSQILNVSGLGYFYQTDSPNKLLELFYDSVDKSKTIGERRNALHQFNRGIQRVNAILMKERFKTFYEELAEFKDARLKDEF